MLHGMLVLGDGVLLALVEAFDASFLEIFPTRALGHSSASHRFNADVFEKKKRTYPPNWKVGAALS